MQYRRSIELTFLTICVSIPYRQCIHSHHLKSINKAALQWIVVTNNRQLYIAFTSTLQRSIHKVSDTLPVSYHAEHVAAPRVDIRLTFSFLEIKD